MREITEIRAYHAHVYFDPETREKAVSLREEIGRRFSAELGRVHDIPVGPHAKAMFQVAFAIEELPKLLPFLMLNRQGLDILVHPRTEDEVADHITNPLWLGKPLPINVAFLEAEV